MKPLCTLLKQLREKAELSQRDLADKCPMGCGITQAVISRWERGVFTPSASQLAVLLSALGVNDTERLEALRSAEALFSAREAA